MRIKYNVGENNRRVSIYCTKNTQTCKITKLYIMNNSKALSKKAYEEFMSIEAVNEETLK